MTALVGLRVVRGRNWEGGVSDGGEGHVGTVVEALADQKVRVIWDIGQETTCRAGADGKFDLIILDSAQAGVCHPGTACAECGEHNIYGMLWRCHDCAKYDLCPVCYNDDKHDLRHRFLRIDHYKSDGVVVKERKTSVRMRAMGAFPGATVKRGPDWEWKDQDGGAGSEGEVRSYENVAPDSSRNLVQVKWACGFANSYRLGFLGKVDVICTEEELGHFYYRDHLPSLDMSTLPYPLAPKDAFNSSSTPYQAATTTTSAKPTAPSPTASSSSPTDNSTTAVKSDPSSTPIMPQSAATHSPAVTEAPPSATDSQGGGATPCADQSGGDGGGSEGGLCFVAGDNVVIGVNENKLRDLQEDFGGVSDSMIKRIGQKGTVTGVTTGIMVRFTSTSYRINPLALVKIMPVKSDDIVRIRQDAELVKLLNKHIAWNQQIAEVCGKTGRIQSMDKDDTVMVNFGHYQTFRFSTACCIPAPGATMDPVGAIGAVRRGVMGGGDANGEGAGVGGAVGGDSGGATVGPVGCGGAGATGGAALSQNNLDAGATVSATPAAAVACADANNAVDATGPTLPTAADNNGGGMMQIPRTDSDTDMGRAMLRMMGLLDSGDHHGGSNNDPQVKILFSAIAQGEVQAVETLLRANMSLMKKTQMTLTPLMYACLKGQREVVIKLLDLGASVNEQGERGRTPLLVALDSEKEDVALLLLENGANPNTKNSRQRSPLHSAAYENLPQAVQILLVMGADVNAKDQVQDTPLFDAIEKDHTAVVEILLQASNLNFRDLNGDGFNMLQLAALRNKPSCSHKSKLKSLRPTQARKEKARSLELIVMCERCPPVDALFHGEYSALHIAANNNHVECIGILALMGGANIDIGDGRRRLTPLHMACKKRHFQSAEALIGLGATVNATDVNGNTSLHLAMGKSLEDDNDDRGVSHDTVIEERTRLARLLISNGAIVDMRDDTGRLPLSYGHKEVQENVARFLMESTAQFSKPPPNPSLPNDSNPTPSSPPPPASTTSGGTTSSTTQEGSADPPSKQFDTDFINKLLQGVSVQCISCESMSDMTLFPCLHKSVCHKCCGSINICPTCGVQVEDKEPDNTDEPEDEEEMNKFN